MAYEYVVVAVPARDEAATIAACLRSIDDAARRSGAEVITVVAADSCSDGTAALANHLRFRYSRLVVVDGGWGCAGAARAAAVDTALAGISARPEKVWIANTDADCAVPPDWLSLQLDLGRFHQAIGGVVELDSAACPIPLLAAFRHTYRLDGAAHGHVHGANLGVRADAYAAVGGWNRATPLGEDRQLWDALAASGRPLLQTTAVRVTTSARTRSRVFGGFATNLSLLASAMVASGA